MKKTLLGLTLALIGLTPAVALAPTKVVTISCPKTWRGSAGGTYGGVPFSVFCASNNGLQILEGTSGTDFTVRMGAENSVAGAFDCFQSGSKETVVQVCGRVRLVIR